MATCSVRLSLSVTALLMLAVQVHPRPATGRNTTCSNFQCRNGQRCMPGEVECNDGHRCMPVKVVCDVRQDCSDGSDEATCRPGNRTTCNPETEFDCSSDGNSCIPLHEVCNQHVNCPNAEDEGEELCNNSVDPCLTNNGGCSQDCTFAYVRHFCTCHHGYKMADDGVTCDDVNECDTNGTCPQSCANTMGSYECTCNDGYTMADDGVTCDDVNECETFGTCSQKCVNTEGSYECTCLPGYTAEPNDFHTCSAEGEEPLLLVADANELRMLNLHTGLNTTVVTDTNKTLAITYDHGEEVIYWSMSKPLIRKMALFPVDGSTRNGTTVGNHLTMTAEPEGLAIDWIHKKLYWTDRGSSSIEVASTEDFEQHATLVDSGLDEPCGLIVDPREGQGWMYVTDYGVNPMVAKVGMDGTHLAIIVTTGLHWPNGITIDYTTDRLFWVDAKFHTIESIDLEGNGRRMILSSEEYLGDPFGIVVFEDSLYWTDWGNQSVSKVDKFGREQAGGVSRVLEDLDDVMQIQVYHNVTQPQAANVCGPDNGGCSHLCLMAPHVNDSSVHFTCKCPDGMSMSSDGRNCLVPASTTENPQSTTNEPSTTTTACTEASNNCPYFTRKRARRPRAMIRYFRGRRDNHVET